MSTPRTLILAVGIAALAAAAAAGWFLLRPATGAGEGAGSPAGPGPASVPGPAPGEGAAPGPADGPPTEGGGGKDGDPDDEADLDRTPHGETGGPTTEEILKAAAEGNWLLVEQLLSVNGSSDPRVTDLMVKTLSDDRFRNKVADLVKYLKDPSALARFLEVARGEGSENTRGAALLACGAAGGPGVFEAASEILRGAKPGSVLASSAAGALGTLGTPEAARVLVDMLRAAAGTPQQALFVESLARVRDPAALEELGRFVNDAGQDARLREAVVTALGRTRDPGAVGELLKAARDLEGEESVRHAAYGALAALGYPEGVEALLGVVHGGSDPEKIEAAAALQNVRSKAAGPLLEKALAGPVPDQLRPYLVTALGQTGGKSSLEILGKIARDGGESAGMRGTAVRAMGEIGETAAGPVILEVVESLPSSEKAFRNQCFMALQRVASVPDLPRMEKLLAGAPDYSTDYFILRQTVERLRKQQAAEQR